jgi:hypothetical protein
MNQRLVVHPDYIKIVSELVKIENKSIAVLK